jgi:hypothetical protein
MKFSPFRKITAGLTFAAIATTLLFQTSTVRAAEHGPVRIDFKKCFVADPDDKDFGGYYAGYVAGDLGVGKVIFTFTSLVPVNPGNMIFQFSGIYAITDLQGNLITAVAAAGIDNLHVGDGLEILGHDVLHGEVIGGAYRGAQAQVRAQDTDQGLCSQGTITITPNK